MRMDNCLFLCASKHNIYNAYTAEQIGDRPVLTRDELFSGCAAAEPVSYIFSTWGMPALTEEEIGKYLPEAKALFYAAGTVQSFARPFLHKGIRVFSAWAANAVPVAEFTVAQIILANKGYFQLHQRYKLDYRGAVDYAQTFCGNYDVCVGLLGAGMIGKAVIRQLKPYRINIKVFDPFMSSEEAVSLGVEKAELVDIFSTCQTISNHLANNKDTQRMLTGEHFAMMKDNATFINTGRGAQVDVEGLVSAMREKPGRTALLDVTDPTEPLPAGSPLWELPNVFHTPHRAGSTTNEVRRMGEYMLEEYKKVLNKVEPLYEVTLSMLETMA